MKPDVLVNGEQMPHVMDRLEERYNLHKLHEADDGAALLRAIGSKDSRHRDRPRTLRQV